MKHKNLICLLLIYSIGLNLLTPFAAAQETQSADDAVHAGTDRKEPKGLQFRLRAGAPQTEKPNGQNSGSAQSLSEPEANAILRRLPEMPAPATDKSNFSLRAGSLPAPKTGNLIKTGFPAAEPATARVTETNSSAPLEVVRFSPEGLVPIAPELSVTFSQPMTAVTSPEQAAENVPVKLIPEVKGKWRWLGTKTLLFDAETRFPMSTNFKATIPAGTKSAVGTSLPKDVSWTFSTPPVLVTKFLPLGSGERRDTLALAVFNQDINREALLPKIRAEANGQHIPIPLRLARTEEIEANENISRVLKELQPNRWIVFRSIDWLPPDAKINIAFMPGLPSAEGELTLTVPQNYSFRTHGTLKFVKPNCGYDGGEKNVCTPQDDLNFEFNNPLDEKSFDKSLVKIEPEIEDAKIEVYGDHINIDGYKTPNKSYKVTVSGALRDEFGQALEKDVTFTFKIGAEEPQLLTRSRDLIVLDPQAKPVFSFLSNNYEKLKVKLYAVEPEDYPNFLAAPKESGVEIPKIGKLVFDKTIPIKSWRDGTVETRINVGPALKNGLGHAVIVVEPPFSKQSHRFERIVTWLEATQIGLDAFADYEKLTVFASNLKDGKPLNNVRLAVFGGSHEAVTAADGLGHLELPESVNGKKGLLIARHGTDAAILPEGDSSYDDDDSDWVRDAPKDELRWFVFNDRNIYRTGETVSIKGYVRKAAGGKFTDIAEAGVGHLNYVLKDSRGSEVLKGAVDLNAFGAFNFQLKLPDNLNLGYQKLELTAESDLTDKAFTHVFQVQEFRRPEFEVSASVETPGPFYVGDSATVTATAKYYAGGALPNAETNWSVRSAPTDYTPPNREDFSFGKFTPWWTDSYESDYEERGTQAFKGVTDREGKHHLTVDFVSVNPARPYTVDFSAGVQDVNRQTFAGSTSLLVHPSELYVGLRTSKTFVEVNTPFKVETITTDIDGRAVAGASVSLIAELKDWQRVKGEWQEVTIDTQTCRISSGREAVACDFTAKKGGTYTITASVTDQRGRRNESDLDVWVAGANKEPSREVERENVELVPGKEDYAPGETAEILVNAPFSPAEGVLTLERNGIVKTERFTMNGSSTVLKIPIEEQYLPNIHVQVDLVGATGRIYYEDARDAKLPKRPAYAGGELDLKVSTASRRLQVTAEPVAKTLEPGGKTAVNVEVRDSQGNAVVGGEVAVVAVDESILALTNYKISDPADVFYREIEAGTTDRHSRENVLLADPEDEEDVIKVETASADGMGSAGPGGVSNSMVIVSGIEENAEAPPPAKMEPAANPKLAIDSDKIPIKTRKNFNALAVFSPSVVTDEYGKAVVNVNLPDNLTRYRITAVAVTKSKQFGKSESNLTARQPLMIRPSAPRFMNFGDRLELPVVVQNQTEQPMTINVAVRAVNAGLTGSSGQRVTVAAGDRAEIRFPVAADKAGLARFQIGAVSGNFADAAEIQFPVYTPATTEAFATYGTTDENGAIVQPVLAPRDVYNEFGGLEITTSSTQLQELTDAFIYLQNYPFECSEQISSRVLSVAALHDVLTTFDAKDMPSKTAIEAKMRSDMERLAKLQHADGGFSFWRSDDRSLPFVSVHVAHALARAKAKGYPIQPDVVSKSRTYLKNVESNYPAWYDQEARWATSAYALYVRDLLGDGDSQKARKLLAEAGLEKLSPESIGWILSALAADKNSAPQVEQIQRHLLNRVTETASTAHFATGYKDGEYVLLSSDRRADGVILEALLRVRDSGRGSVASGQDDPKSKVQNPKPDEELIAKIVRGLLANKIKGRWANTQENVFVLLALDKYFQTFEKVTPNFVTRVWLGASYGGEQAFTGRSTDSKAINVPMDYLQTMPAENGASNLILDKQGAGRLYYRIGMSFAPKDLRLGATDFGFTIRREYEAVDNPADVKQLADGSWTIKSGARVRVKIQMILPARRYHVALVDKLPAGLEIINTALKVSETVPNEPPPQKRSGIYRMNWFEHENLRDERAEVFASLLADGVYEYSYVARATTPGNFVAPPAKAEEMYAPETFGRSRTDFVKVE